jgi:hypothetical protein
MRAAWKWIVVPLLVACASAPPPARAPANPGPPPLLGPRVATSGVMLPPEPLDAPLPASPSAEAAATVITRDLVFGHLTYLASDELRGRDTPSLGLELAAQYVADEFRTLGLEPAGEGGGYIQRWSYQSTQLDYGRVALEGRGPRGSATATFARDYFIAPARGDSVHAPVAWAGTAGPVMPALNPGEAAGRVLVFLLPGLRPDLVWQQAMQAAIRNAAPAAPAGILFLLDPAFPRAAVAQVAASLSDGGPMPVHVAGLRWETAREFFAQADADLDAVRMRSEPGVHDIEGLRVLMRPAVASAASRPPNVAAILRGSDPELRETYVIFSAHIDHIGVDLPDSSGDSIYNGADDNASGTSAVLAVARAFAALATPPARSVIFVGVSGEEDGLFGSDHFVDHPPVPRTGFVANLNIDMVGRNSPDFVAGVGMAYSNLGPLADMVARSRPELGLRVVEDPWPGEQLFFRSDHYNFARIGVPSLFFTTGLHGDYHKPSDSADRIDADKVARVARLLFHIGYQIANDPDRPTWTDRGRREVLGVGGGPETARH